MSSSMYNSIHHFLKFGVKNIEKKIKSFLEEGKDLADLVFDLEEDLYELGRNILVEVLEEIDQYLCKSWRRKKKWEIVRRDETSILTSFGTITYNRTYFKPKAGGKRKYLVDELVGIKPHDRVSEDVVIKTIDEAIDSSYRKAGRRASYTDELSKQTVMNKIHSLEIKEPEIEVNEKRDVRVLYIEADEDHVSLQNKRKGQKKIAMPKLVYVHEGIDLEKSSKTRRSLKNVRYFGGIYKESEELWLEIIDYIYKQYDIDSIETIYISGDGASWIRTGLDWIPKSRFVLDKYHLRKYMLSATAHLKEENFYQELKEALNFANEEKVKEIFKDILKQTESKTKRKAVMAARWYILNNWDGIAIKAEKGSEIVGCSAEGHVSHVFSDRLSSRSRGWSEIGVCKMAKLIIYKKNGGKIYDLVMGQKSEEKEAEKLKEERELAREIENLSSSRYADAWDGNIIILAMGKHTGLFKELKSISGY